MEDMKWLDHFDPYLLVSLFNSGCSIVEKIILTVAVVVIVKVIYVYKMIHSITLCFNLNGNSKKMNCHENNIFTIVYCRQKSVCYASLIYL